MSKDKNKIEDKKDLLTPGTKIFIGDLEEMCISKIDGDESSVTLVIYLQNGELDGKYVFPFNK